MGADFCPRPRKRKDMDEKQITSGALYDAHDINPTSDKARVISVHDGIVAYEHVSQTKVTLYATIDDFVKMWKIV
jgi:hypothetical protein